MARQSKKGLKPGTRVHVKGQGKYANGVISPAPSPDEHHIYYRCDYNKGERLVEVKNVSQIFGPRFKEGEPNLEKV